MLSALYAGLFEPTQFNLFQILTVVFLSGVVCWVAGAAWGGDLRDELDLTYAGRDLQGEARRGELDRRRQPRAPHVRHAKTDAQGLTREPNREWTR